MRARRPVAYGTELTVAGTNIGERRETQVPRIRLEYAPFETPANGGEPGKINSESVSEGSNPSPAAPPKPLLQGFHFSPASLGPRKPPPTPTALW